MMTTLLSAISIIYVSMYLSIHLSTHLSIHLLLYVSLLLFKLDALNVPFYRCQN